MAKGRQIVLPDPKRSRPAYPTIPSSAVSGLGDRIRTIRFTIGLVTASSTTPLPANARVLRADCNVTAVYDNGATLAVGISTNTGLFLSTLQTLPAIIDRYSRLQDTDVGAAAIVVQATVAGGVPTTGAAEILVTYALPNV